MMRVLRALTVFGTLAALGAAVHAEVDRGDAFSLRASARRVLTYDLSGPPPSFPLSGGDTLLRLVTNALLPDGAGPDDVPYTVEVRVRRPWMAEEVRTVALLSHRTGARNDGTDACFDDAGSAIADSRRVDLPLDPPAPPGTEITVRAVGPVAALVRAWTLQPRASPTRTARMYALYPELRREVGDALGLAHWDHLSDDERRALHDEGFSRLAAAGRPGIAYRFHDMYLRDVPPVLSDLSGPAEDLSRPVTWVLEGPVKARVRLAAPAGTPASHLRAFLAAGVEVPLGNWEIGADRPSIDVVLDLPAGRQALGLVSDSAAPLQVRVDAPDEVPAATLHLHASPIGPAVAAGEARQAVFDAEVPTDAEARNVELELWATTDRDPVVQVRTETASGARDDVVQGRYADNAYDAWRDEDGAVHALRGPLRAHVLLPADARWLRVSSDAPALVRFRVPFHDAPEADAPVVTERAIAMDDVEALRTWARPVRSGDDVEVVVKPRVELVPPPVGVPLGWVASALDALGMATRVSVLEPVRGALTGKFVTELPNGRALKVQTSAAGNTRARWSYEVDAPEALGANVPLRIDGQEVAKLRLALRRGTLRVPPLTPGEHLLEALAPPGARVFVNLPAMPGQGAPAYRNRTVWRLSTDPVTVRVRVAPLGPRALNLVVYDPALGARPDLSVTAIVDGGQPRRRTQGLYTRRTPPRRVWSLPPAAHAEPAVAVDGARTSIGVPHVVSLPLGDDLALGMHTIRVQAARAVHVRFFVVAPPSVTQGDAATLGDDFTLGGFE